MFIENNRPAWLLEQRVRSRIATLKATARLTNTHISLFFLQHRTVHSLLHLVRYSERFAHSFFLSLSSRSFPYTIHRIPQPKTSSRRFVWREHAPESHGIKRATEWGDIAQSDIALCTRNDRTVPKT